MFLCGSFQQCGQRIHNQGRQCCGNASYTTQQSYTTNGATWANGYLGVWHLKETAAGTGMANLYSDSTVYTNHGDDYCSATGRIGVEHYGQQFNGSTDYVQLETSSIVTSTLGASNFTLSAWIRRTGAGLTTSTGTGGVIAEPVLSKGRSERDNSTLDMNYFLGIDPAGGNVLAVDFEEGATGTIPGDGHPFYGTTSIPSNVWVAVTVTYDGTWRLCINGNLDAQLYVGQPPRWDGIQVAANRVGAELKLDSERIFQRIH